MDPNGLEALRECQQTALDPGEPLNSESIPSE